MCVAILCEYDALPEIGHACGHNLIAEAGIAASLGVKAAVDKAGMQLGKVCIHEVDLMKVNNFYIVIINFIAFLRWKHCYG